MVLLNSLSVKRNVGKQGKPKVSRWRILDDTSARIIWKMD